MEKQPASELARRVLPVPLYRALTRVYAEGVSDCVLVGGTALAGYYAGHRRSDDLDLFVADQAAHRATVLAVNRLVELGASFAPVQTSASYYSVTCTLSGHHFTIDVVLDSNLFRIGHPLRADDGVWVADLTTLLRQKAATLVSRCSEKDLYDLLWICEQNEQHDLNTLIELGAQIDAGMNAEAVLVSLATSQLSRSACDFSLTEPAADVFDKVVALKTELQQGFDRIAREQPAPRIGQLIRALKARP